MNQQVLTTGQQFIQFYQSNGFQALPRSSLLHDSLPMTFVMSAGRVQIEHAIQYGQYRTGENYVLLQPCFRHFDREKVGHSPIYLSLFEMGGAFYFGPPQTEDALTKIWHFLTVELGLPSEQLWATYFAGGKLDGCHLEADAAAALAWQNIGLATNRTIGLGPEDNFWKQGGGLSGQRHFRKCGPTVELFFDRGLQWACGPTCQPGCQCNRFVELVNIVFVSSEFNQLTKTLNPSATPFIETVIGIERLTMALQKQLSIFKIEPYASLIQEVRSYFSDVDLSGSVQTTVSEQIIVDHLRSLLFLVADNAPPPGKGGRQWILRLLMRAVFTHQKLLNISHPAFIENLIEIILDFYQPQYTNLDKARLRLLAYFEMERNRFEITLDKGNRRLEQLIQRNGQRYLSGSDALNLVKQYGFPLPLLEVKLTQGNIELDKYQYWEAHNRWKQTNHQQKQGHRRIL